MSYNVGEKKNNQYEVSFKIEKDEWQEAIKQAYNKTKGNFKIEGFRKGKAPKNLIERTYGQSVFYEEAFDIILQKSYYDCIQKENIIPVSHPEIKLENISEEGLSFIAVITVAPEIVLPKNIKVKKPEVKEVSDQDIENELKNYQEKASSYIEITDRACELGDTVEIDYSGSVNGVKFEGGTAERQPLLLGSGQFIPGFEDQVVSMHISDEKDINVKFPDDYGHDELKGKDAVFKVKLHAIKRKEVPPIDDELAKDVSEFDTIEELKNDIREKLKKQNEEKALMQYDNDIMTAYIEAVNVEVPEAMINDASESLIKEFEQRLTYQGLNAKDYYKYTGTTKEDLKKQYHDEAKKRVLSMLILEQLLKERDIKVNKEDIEAKIEEMAKQYNLDPNQYKTMAKGLEEYIEKQLISEKLFEQLRSEAE